MQLVTETLDLCFFGHGNFLLWVAAVVVFRVSKLSMEGVGNRMWEIEGRRISSILDGEDF